MVLDWAVVGGFKYGFSLGALGLGGVGSVLLGLGISYTCADFITMVV